MTDTAQQRIRLKKVEYARHRGVSPALVTRWFQAGRLVMDGKLVDVAASDAALEASSSPIHGGKRSSGGAARAASSYAEQGVPPRDEDRGLPAARPNNPAGSGFIQSKTRQTELGNALLELKLLQEQKRLVIRKEFEGGFVEGLAPAFAKLRGIAVRIAPEVIAAGGDIRKVQEIIEAGIERALEDASETVAALIDAPEATQQ